MLWFLRTFITINARVYVIRKITAVTLHFYKEKSNRVFLLKVDSLRVFCYIFFKFICSLCLKRVGTYDDSKYDKIDIFRFLCNYYNFSYYFYTCIVFLTSKILITLLKIKPVSYTHLDVYKRQLQMCTVNWVVAQISDRYIRTIWIMTTTNPIGRNLHNQQTYPFGR